MHLASTEFLILLAPLLFRIHGEHGPIRGRQVLGIGEDYCFGLEGICSYLNDLSADCNGFENESDLTQWYQCICGNGYVSSSDECFWCQVAFNLTSPTDQLYLDAASADSSGCSSAHATIAPVPSSVLASLSAWNSSFSSWLTTPSTLGGSSATPTATGKTGTTTSFGLSTAVNTAPATGSGGNSSSWTSTYTLDSPSVDTSAATEGTGASQTGSSRSGAESLRTSRSAVGMLSILSFGISVICVL